MPTGFSQSEPYTIGEEDDTLLRVRVAQPVCDELSVGQAAWVTGDGVDPLLEEGALIDITGRLQAGRLFLVGEYSYTSLSDATRASEALGQPVIEVA